MFNPNVFKILIVDDIARNLQVLGNLLKEEGYNVEFATSGKQALKWVERDDFDLILLDIMMPEMTGFDVCLKLKKQPKYSDIPVIFLTAHNEEDSIIKGFEYGGQDYLTKPFNSKELIIRIKTHLELKKSQEELRKLNSKLESLVIERTKDLKKAHKELEKTHMELIELENAKNEFLKIVSHEIRTPLNGIIPVFQLIKEKNKDEELIKLLSILDTAVDRLEKFSKTALLITEIRSQKYEMFITKLNLLDFTKECIQQQNANAEDKGIHILIQEPEYTIEVEGDIMLLMHAMGGILENAIIYSERNESISISFSENEKYSIIVIQDKGKGFSDKAIKNLFKLFGVGQAHINDNLGLSLTLTKLIMDLHKGKLEIKNLEPSGASVSMYLPK